MRKYIFIGCLLTTACHSRQAQTTNVERHLAMISRPGKALYIDRADNRMVMQNDSAAQRNFCSYLVGFTDSSADTRLAAQKEKYFQYTMQGDWKALVNGDTLRAVFFQEKPGLNSQRKEGVIVFETTDGRQPDTLIYRDTFDNWGTQILSVKENKQKDVH